MTQRACKVMNKVLSVKTNHWEDSYPHDTIRRSFLLIHWNIYPLKLELERSRASNRLSKCWRVEWRSSTIVGKDIVYERGRGNRDGHNDWLADWLYITLPARRIERFWWLRYLLTNKPTIYLPQNSPVCLAASVGWVNTVEFIKHSKHTEGSWYRPTTEPQVPFGSRTSVPKGQRPRSPEY